MKTAVSIPDSIFRRTERIAKKMKKTRSRVVSEALQEYLACHSSDDVTDAMNRVVRDLDTSDPFVAGAMRRILVKSDW